MAQFTSDILTPEVGAIFRNARLAKGLSVEDVASKLRMNPHYVDRIEAGDVRSLPPEPYRKAFIKEYARFIDVKLDKINLSGDESRSDRIRPGIGAIPDVAKKVGKEVVNLAEDVAQTTVKTTETVVKKAGEGVMDAVDELRSKDLWAEADEVRKERLGISNRSEQERELTIRRRETAKAEPKVEKIEPKETPPPIRPAPRVELRQPTQRIDLDRAVREEAEQMPLPEQDYNEISHSGMSRSTKIIVGLLVVIVGIIVFSVVSKRSKLPEPPVVATTVEQPQTKPQPAQKKTEQPKVADSAKAVAPTNDSILTFSITAKDSVWVSITPDIGTGFRGKMKAGETKEFTAKEKYFIFLGNQKSVAMTLNGRALSGLPTVAGSNMVVRNVILTKDKAVLATADQTPAVVKQQAIKKDTAHKKPEPKPVPKKTVPQKNTIPAKPKQPIVKKPTTTIKKTIPTTPPILPRPN